MTGRQLDFTLKHSRRCKICSNFYFSDYPILHNKKFNLATDNARAEGPRQCWVTYTLVADC